MLNGPGSFFFFETISKKSLALSQKGGLVLYQLSNEALHTGAANDVHTLLAAFKQAQFVEMTAFSGSSSV